MRKGQRKCARCGKAVAFLCSAQEMKVRNWRPAKEAFFIKKAITYKTVPVCRQCYDAIKTVDERIADSKKEGSQDCPACDGTGKVEEDLGGGRTREYKCTPCRGTGKKSGYTGTFPEFLKEDQ